MKLIKTGMLLLVALVLASPSWAKPLQVITTTTDLGWMVKEIGGDEVTVTALLTGREDPHYVDAVPRFIRLVADADMVCLVGMELEIGWMPKVLSRSANAQVQPGGKGYCETGKTVKALDVISGSIDRSMGDIHAGGNPHFHLSPQHLAQAGETVLGTLIELRPEATEDFMSRFSLFQEKMEQLHATIKAKLVPVADIKFIEYHKEFSYFINAYGIHSTGAIESVPGVPPSAGRLASAALNAKKDGVKLVIAANHNPAKVLNRFTSMSQIPVVRLMTSIETSGEIDNYEKLQHHITDSILQAVKK